VGWGAKETRSKISRGASPPPGMNGAMILAVAVTAARSP
jgi:hypothetical protein